MIAQVKAKRYVACPREGCVGEFFIEHVFGTHWEKGFGPWYCQQDHCDVVLTRGSINDDGSLEVEFSKRKEKRGLALLLFGDAFLIYEEHTLHDPKVNDSYDYFFHSHQCPINLLRGTVDVFIGGHRDIHGQIRYVASVEDTPALRDRLHDGVNNLDELLALFETDGSLPPTMWPPENEGLIPWLAELRRRTTQKDN